MKKIIADLLRRVADWMDYQNETKIFIDGVELERWVGSDGNITHVYPPGDWVLDQ